MGEKEEKENDDFVVEIEKCDDVTRIRISGVNRSKFDNAYRLATHLTNRVKELDIESEEERKLQIARKQMETFWTRKGSIWKLDASISDASHRIALALLRTHPECKKQVDVANMTNVPKKTVSNHLSGKVDLTRQYFHKSDKGYRLSDEGLQWVFDKIIPSLFNPSNEQINNEERNPPD